MTGTSRSTAMLVFIALAAVACAAPVASAQGREGAFERTLTVTGPVDLHIRSGSGRIRVHPGADGTVTVSARIRGNSWLFSGDVAERIREIEKNPPIEQRANSIRVGRENDGLFRNISISYDVTVPAETTVNAGTGSGGVDIGDLRGPVEARTGSGSIVLGRVAGPVVVSTGSGGIQVTGAQSLEARSGSGSIRASGIAGATKANTGSGGITIEGSPLGPWDIHASSGTVTLRLPPDAAFDLDARANSGGIDSTHPITIVGRVDRHRMQGKVRGGGALVQVSTSSGGIRIR